MKKIDYISPEIILTEISVEGVLCYSHKFDIPLGGWDDDGSDTGGDAV